MKLINTNNNNNTKGFQAALVCFVVAFVLCLTVFNCIYMGTVQLVSEV